MEAQLIKMQTTSTIESPVLDIIESRRSLRAYSVRPVEEEKIKSLFEAARWAPSSMNEQPWTYLYATKEQPELWSKVFETLSEGNKIWAVDAPLLIASFVRTKHIRNGVPNNAARYDLGGANAFLSLQATALGLNVHQMGGFDKAKLVENLNVPLEEYEPVVVMAIGYPGDAEKLPENLKQRETSPRVRYTQESFVMNKSF
ncbi:MAG: nitroreductase family protein [Cyclobacteriaceae bacterium]|nr:nitroreductase family protein [Cyclobacteriaceae bacterium]UYN87286.1 MAG: nitroreductase family protein [Cyclobacteriaceae bacterium]